MTRSFDYIVIGSGSAGAVIASRLSEDPAVSVLLLEAGGRDRHPFQLMPLAFIKVAKSRFGTWRFETEPEPGLDGRKLEIKRGRTLGGSSSINAMIAIRGNRTDYDLWRQQGLDGWSYDDVLPYFRKLENSWRGASDFHGTGGPIQASPTIYPEMLFEAHKAAAIAAGYGFNDDPNGVAQEGLARMEQTTGSGVRSSSARAYLHSVLSRGNLTVETGALTTRVLIEKGRAVGVEYAQDGRLVRARAEREVIVCGGSYNSPQILMLSGIGPADHLKSVGITPLHDLPGVGQNLGEHPNILNIYKARGKVGFTRFLRLDRAAAQVMRWYADHGGPFATNGAAANLFLRTRDGLDRPDVQCIAMTLSNSAELWFPGATAAPNYCFSIRVGALHPLSRGWVKLRSANPADHPRILFNMFAEKSDLDTMVRGVRACRELYAQKPLADMIECELAPGDAKQSDDDIAAFIRANAGHRSHPVGTCRMGIDDMAVVDAQLRVRGIEGLRVADASIMPELPSGNTNLPTIMIGEKTADMIKTAA